MFSKGKSYRCVDIISEVSNFFEKNLETLKSLSTKLIKKF